MKNSPQLRVLIASILILIFFAWVPIVPCTYTGPTSKDSDEIITVNIPCPINPFLVRHVPKESYKYFGILDRSNPLSVTILYTMDIILAYSVSYLFFEFLPKKFKEREKTKKK